MSPSPIRIPITVKEYVQDTESPFLNFSLNTLVNVNRSVCGGDLGRVGNKLEPASACGLVCQMNRQLNVHSAVEDLQNQLQQSDRAHGLTTRLKHLLTEAQQTRQTNANKLLQRFTGFQRRLHLELSRDHTQAGESSEQLRLFAAGDQGEALTEELGPTMRVFADNNELDAFESLRSQIGLVHAMHQHIYHVILHKCFLLLRNLISPWSTDRTFHKRSIVVYRTGPMSTNDILRLNGGGLSDLGINLGAVTETESSGAY